MSTIVASPLDQALRNMLNLVGSYQQGFQPGPQNKDVAQSLDVPEAFVEALFVSAKTRGLLKPQPVGRGRYRWTLSTRGEAFLHES